MRVVRCASDLWFWARCALRVAQWLVVTLRVVQWSVVASSSSGKEYLLLQEEEDLLLPEEEDLLLPDEEDLLLLEEEDLLPGVIPTLFIPTLSRMDKRYSDVIPMLS